jgi:phenol hydroxylase P2 protein
VSTQAPERPVGVDLQDSTDDARALVQAIEKDNPNATVSHLPGLVKITTTGALHINRATVQDLIGRDWETHEFQLHIVSYFGHIAEWDDDQIVIKWDH